MDRSADPELRRVIEHPDPDVSVVIPTTPDRDLRTVEHLREQSAAAFEVVVVVDRADDDFRCVARNRGLEASRAELIAFTDDDCAPPSDWLSVAVETFREHPDVVLLEGPVDEHSPGPRHYVGANLAVRRSAALAVDGFDQRFSGGLRDDTDFGWRIEKAHGVDSCKHLPDWEMRHVGPLKSDGDAPEEANALLRREHPHRFFGILRPHRSPLVRTVQTLTALAYRVSPKVGDAMFEWTRSGWQLLTGRRRLPVRGDS